MSALTILIIRHAEKPPKKEGDPDFGLGVTERGQVDDHSLAVRGWQRAGAWARLFAPGDGGRDYPSPGVVFAADPGKVSTDVDSISKRPLQTVQPLCRRLNLSPNTKFGVGDEPALVAEAIELTGTVLIAWEHKKIGKAIIPAILGVPPPPGVPAEWDRLRFDVVLRFDRELVGAPWIFRQLFPRLLDGDSDVPLGSGKE
jgi:hypothetical protein